MADEIQRIWILGGLTPDFYFDAVLSEEHGLAATITDDPAETGLVFSDHIYHAPDRLTIEAAVSDIALHAGAPDPDDPFAEGDDPFASSTSRSMKAFDLIRQLKLAGEPFSVQSGLRLYGNMLVENVNARQDAATGSALVFRAELKQVTITSTRTVTVPIRKPGKTARKGAAKVDNGTQPATTPDAVKAMSALRSMGMSSPTATDLLKQFIGIDLGGPPQ